MKTNKSGEKEKEALSFSFSIENTSKGEGSFGYGVLIFEALIANIDPNSLKKKGKDKVIDELGVIWTTEHRFLASIKNLKLNNLGEFPFVS
ncbi:hypothetical protein CXB51_018388 [Gossypium anomalum]|uniref:Uncharacterized protein n=1 Tax=Gossypium anomalum TaxID=47600 RepID=A0A8J5YD67_9ROSI|nr:hypothetical protein CXB51_018388 [Gossypium anomalum]